MGKTTLVFRFEKTDTVREVIEMDTDTDQIHGTYVTFYEDGIMKSEELYRQGRKHGIHRSYHPNGNMHIVSEWEDGSPVGAYSVYSEDNKTIEESYYDNGKKVVCFQMVDGVLKGFCDVVETKVDETISHPSVCLTTQTI